MTAAPQILTALLDVDSALAREGVHAASPFWREQWQRFYLHHTASTLIECVGRGGDKSRTSVKMAIAETLAGAFHIAPGERHYFTHISENVAEAVKTLNILERYLTILRIPFRRNGDTVDLEQLPRGFKVLACRVGAVSGWRSFGWTADEISKWQNDGVDPSEEVIASISAMTVTHPEARGRLFSSPLARMGYFYECWAQGDTADQVTGQAPSWIANPGGIAEAITRKKEPRERFWQREYAAIPTGNISSVFTEDVIDTAFQKPKFPMVPIGNLIMVLDPSSGRKDTWAFCLAGWWQRQHSEADRWLYEDTVDPNEGHATYLQVVGRHVKRDALGHPMLNPDFGTDEPVFAFTRVDGFEGAFAKDISAESIVATLAANARRWGVDRVIADQRESYLLEAAFARHGMRYQSIPWTNASKSDAVSWVTRLLRERRLGIEPHEKLRKELLGFREKILPSGAITYEGRTDDYVALLLTAAMGDVNGLFDGSPTQKPRVSRVTLGAGDFRNP